MASDEGASGEQAKEPERPADARGTAQSAAEEPGPKSAAEELGPKSAAQELGQMGDAYLHTLLKNIKFMLHYVNESGILLPDDVRAKLADLLTRSEIGDRRTTVFVGWPR